MNVLNLQPRCAECGAIIPLNKGKICQCPQHPEAKRLPEPWSKKQFQAMRKAVAAVAVDPVPVPVDGTGWSDYQKYGEGTDARLRLREL